METDDKMELNQGSWLLVKYPEQHKLDDREEYWC
jgi:hypothetical protein